MRIDFTNQVALVTGATRGIGRQIAKDMLELGAKLILTGRDREQTDKLKGALTNDKKENVSYYCVDFSSNDDLKKFLAELEKVDCIDVCINNAGINRINYIEETLEEDWDEVMAVNLKAPYMIMRQICRKMKLNRYGRIVNIGSIFGNISREKRSTYSSSKFGLKGLTVSIATELARYNVLVNTVSPGFVLTDLTRRILSEQEIQELVGQIPAGRCATPEDISNVVLFLASTLNTYVAGQDVIVDGGYVNV